MTSLAPQPKATAFYPFVHILRGVAPLIVMWAHLALFFVLDQKVTDWDGTDLWNSFFALPLHLYQNGGHLGVVIFFFVSGFIITHASMRETATEFAIKRGLRIFPVLAVALAVTYVARYIALHMGLGELTGTKATSWRDFIGAFFMLDMLLAKPQVLVVTWSLVTEVMYYLMTLVLLRQTRENPERATYLMITGWVVLELLSSGFTWLAHSRYFSLYVGLLIAGRVIYLADSLIGWRKGVPMLLLIAILFILFYSNAQPGVLMQSATEPVVSYVLGAAIFLAALTYGATKVPQILAFFADISLSLYLLHLPVGMLVNVVLRSFGVPFTLCLVFSVALSILMSWISFKVIEQPCQHLARRITHKKASV